MIWLLDTNVVSAVRRPGRAPQVEAWLAAQAEADLHVSVITLGEIERGIRQAERRDKTFAADLRSWLDTLTRLFADRVRPFEQADAVVWGRLSADLGRTDTDVMLAAQAIAQGATVATRNVQHFAPTGAAVFDPF